MVGGPKWMGAIRRNRTSNRFINVESAFAISAARSCRSDLFTFTTGTRTEHGCPSRRQACRWIQIVRIQIVRIEIAGFAGSAFGAYRSNGARRVAICRLSSMYMVESTMCMSTFRIRNSDLESVKLLMLLVNGR